MIKNRLAKLLALAMVATIFAAGQPAQAASGACKQSGVLQLDKGKRFVCKKAGTKLVWQLDSSYKPTKIDDFEQVGPQVLGQISKLKQRSTTAFKVHWDPTTTPAKRSFYEKQIESMDAIFGPLVPAGKTIQLFILGSNKTWGTAKLKEFAKSDQSFLRDYTNKFVVSTDCKMNELEQTIPDNVTYGEPYTEQRGRGGGISPTEAFAFVTLSNCDNSNEKDLLPHEAFHAVQWLNAWTLAKWPGSSKTFGLNAASWLTEGQAQYFGRLISQNLSFKFFADEETKQFASNVSERWRTEYKYLNSYETTDTYVAGAVMFEFLAARFGLVDTLKLQAQTNLFVPGLLAEEARYTPFEKTFKAMFGMTIEQFMAEARAYLDWSLAKTRN